MVVVLVGPRSVWYKKSDQVVHNVLVHNFSGAQRRTFFLLPETSEQRRILREILTAVNMDDNVDEDDDVLFVVCSMFTWFYIAQILK